MITFMTSFCDANSNIRFHRVNWHEDIFLSTAFVPAKLSFITGIQGDSFITYGSLIRLLVVHGDNYE